jgi:phage-related minor tail protein
MSAGQAGGGVRQLPATVSQSIERVRNAFGQWVQKMDESTGMTKKLSEALTWLAQNMDTVMKWLTIIKDVGLAC